MVSLNKGQEDMSDLHSRSDRQSLHKVKPLTRLLRQGDILVEPEADDVCYYRLYGGEGPTDPRAEPARTIISV